ncbi:MAG: TIGR01777 family oxidoreductase [Janthinobacterium lividum]
MRILISGSTGLIGRHLMTALRASGSTVVPLVRNGEASGTVHWDPAGKALNPDLVSGFDIVIHLAGEPVATGLWTAAKRRKIYDSRVDGTRKLAEALAAAKCPPRMFLSASGINYYGDRGDTILDETQPLGQGFLAEVCRNWEAAAAPLAGLARIVHLRIGIVLAEDGGTLPAMLPLFRLGLGGPVAGGRAYVSWITIRDLVRAITYIVESDRLEGPLNLVSPHPATNREFTIALAKALGRAAILPVPGWAVRFLLGQLGVETVLSSVRAVPEKLLRDGFTFHDAHIALALKSVLAPRVLNT